MGSNSLQTRQSQKAALVREAEARKALLTQKGLTEASVAKDPVLRHLKAKIKQITSAMARISFLENQTKQLQEKKEQAKAAAEAARLEAIAGGTKSKGKKKAAEAEAEAEAPKKEAKAGKKAPAKAKEGAKPKQK
jgi:hypothetical protein